MTLELKKVNKPILILCIKYLDFFFLPAFEFCLATFFYEMW